MLDPALQLTQQLRAPLAALQGARPPAPRWFDDAIAKPPERSFVEVEGARIELLTWGRLGAPGLLLVHGGRAHADWWSFIAPFFADHYRVAALSLSGMGRSDWRERYSIPQYARELMAATAAGGLRASRRPPLMVAHSFGSIVMITAAADPAADLAGAVVLDSAISAPDQPDHQPGAGRPNRIYDTLADALAHFRLLPPQPCDNLFLLDYIARQSLKPVPRAQGGEGYTWRFDPNPLQRTEGDDTSRRVRDQADLALRAIPCPLAFIRGEQSVIVRKANLAYTRSIAPEGTLFRSIPDAAHHVFLDQPLAVVEMLESTFAAWAS